MCSRKIDILPWLQNNQRYTEISTWLSEFESGRRNDITTFWAEPILLDRAVCAGYAVEQFKLVWSFVLLQPISYSTS